jgi:two-component system, response regulator / RNA-binding antiterminator
MAPNTGSLLKILVIGESQELRDIIHKGLILAGVTNISAYPVPERLAELVQRSAPDVLMLAFTKPDANLQSQILLLPCVVSLPIALFVEQCGSDAISAAVDGGIAAIVVDGLKKERVGAVLELAIARFRSVAKLKAALSTAQSALKDRKVIDRAKGALMKANGLDEDAAYALLRETAMRQSRKISDVAESLLNTIDLIQPAARER